MAQVVQLLWDSQKPVIARVNGAARAGGIGLIAACDIAIAAEHASFAFSEVRIGVVPAVISVPCLRRMPSRAAAEYFLTGEVFHATRAVEIGLLTKAVAVEDLDAEVSRYADMLRRGAPNALAATKGVLRDGRNRLLRRRTGPHVRAVGQVLRLGRGPRGNGRLRRQTRPGLGDRAGRRGIGDSVMRCGRVSR